MNRATVGLGVGVMLVLGGGFFAATIPAKKNADVELRAAWGAYAGCMAGGPIPNGVAPHEHLRRIAVSLGPTDDSWTPDRWPDACSDERNALQKRARRVGAKEFFYLPYDRAAVIEGHGLDEAWAGANARGFVATPSSKAPRPPALLAETSFRYLNGSFTHEATLEDGAIFRWLPHQGKAAICRFGGACIDLDGAPDRAPSRWHHVPTNQKAHLATFGGDLLVDGTAVPVPRGTIEVVGLHVEADRLDAVIRRLDAGSTNRPPDATTHAFELVRDLRSEKPKIFPIQALDWARMVGDHLVGSEGEQLFAWSLMGAGAPGEARVLRTGVKMRPHLSCTGEITSGLLVQSGANDDDDDDDGNAVSDEAILATPNAIQLVTSPLGIPKAIGCMPWGVRIAKSYEPVETGAIPKTSTDVFTCTLAAGCLKEQALETWGHLHALGFADADVVAVTSSDKYGVHLVRMNPKGALVDVALTEHEKVFDERRVHVFGDVTKTMVVAGNELLTFAIAVPKVNGIPESVPVR